MVLQDAGAGVYVMPAEHLGLGMVLLHAVFVVFETSVLVVLARSLEQRDARDRRSCASTRRSSAPSSRMLAEALERRDLSVTGEAGDGAAAILRSGIGHVATLVETIQSAAVEITQTSQRGVRRLGRLRALQRARSPTRSPASPPRPSSRPGS